MQWGRMQRARPNLAARSRRQPDEAAQPSPGRQRPDGQRPSAGSGWRRVPPIDLAVQTRPVLIGGQLLGLPEVSGTRSLLTRQPGQNGDRDTGQESRPGRITGIVQPQPQLISSAETSSSRRGRRSAQHGGRDAQPAAPGPATGPARGRLRPAVRPAPADRQNLIEATGELVGAPQPAETPYTSSAWLRMLQAYRMPAGPADLAEDPLPGLTQAAKPDGGTLTSWSSSVTEPPPRLVLPDTAAPEAQARPAERPRRASLAESRRLGLGSPRALPARADTPPTGGDPAESHHLVHGSPPAQPAQGEALFGSAEDPPGNFSDPPARPEPTEPEPTEPQPTEPQASPDRPRPTTTRSTSTTGQPQAHRPPLGLGAPITRPDLGPAGTRRDWSTLTPGPAGDRPHQTPQETRHPNAPRAHHRAEPLPKAAADTGPPPGPRTHESDLSHLAGLTPALPPSAPALPEPRAASSAPADQTGAALPPGAGQPAKQHPPAHSTAIVAPVYRAAKPATAPAAPGQSSPHQPRPSATARTVPLAQRPARGQPAAPQPEAGEPAPPAAGSSAESAQHLDSPAYRTRVPHDLADTMRRAYGVDVSDVLVSRGPLASHQANQIGARAFARGGEVVLPPEAGPIERPQTRALLAHELTHVAQQRVLGPNLPAEDSAAGAALERQAQDVERQVLGSQPPATRAEPENPGPLWQPPAALQNPDPAPAFPPLPPSSFPVFSPPPPPPTSAFPPPPQSPTVPPPTFPASAPSSPAPIQRQTVDLPTAAPIGNAFDPFALLPAQPVAEPPPRPADLIGDQPPPPPIPAAQDDGFGQARARLLTLAGQRLLNLDDSIAVGNLADGIYKSVRARLRHELLVDRERSGLLSDFR